MLFMWNHIVTLCKMTRSRTERCIQECPADNKALQMKLKQTCETEARMIYFFQSLKYKWSNVILHYMRMLLFLSQGGFAIMLHYLKPPFDCKNSFQWFKIGPCREVTLPICKWSSISFLLYVYMTVEQNSDLNTKWRWLETTGFKWRKDSTEPMKDQQQQKWCMKESQPFLFKLNILSNHIS